jgi:thiamine biosynthesis lipoprotein
MAVLTRALLSVAVAALATPAPAQVFLTGAEALALAFPGADRVDKTLAVVSRDEATAIRERLGRGDAATVFRFWTGYRDGRPIGHAVIDDVLGKSRPITYMVVVDRALNVQRVDIMVYRESHGGEVRVRNWCQQFEGRSPTDTLRVGHGIRNIAGATISCRSVTDGVGRMLAHLAVLHRHAAGFDAAECPAGNGEEPRAGEPVLRRSRLLMGTTLTITLAAEGDAAGAAEAAFAEVDRLERILSDWRTDSELSIVNAAAGRGPRRCSAELVDFLAACERHRTATGGAVDVAAGRLVELWRRAAQLGRQPTAAEVEAARRASGAPVTLDPAARTVTLPAGVRLDPGAVGKGFALDRAAVVLRDREVAHALLDFGGQVLALGPMPDGAPWRVELRAPGPDHPPTVLWLCGGSLATSADYERGLTIAGDRVSHVVDPRTGRPIVGTLAATVFADDATTADALSTALFVMGPRDGQAWATQHEVAARLEGTDDDVRTTAAFDALILDRR